jgi:hypothetical protein
VKRVASIAVLFAAFGLGSWLYWQWSATQFQAGLENWKRMRAAEGYVIDHDSPELTGYPAGLTARLGSPRVVSPEGWQWEAGEATLEAGLFSANRLLVSARGPQALTGITVDSEIARRFDSDHADISLILSANGSPLSGEGRIDGYRVSMGNRELLRGKGASLSFLAVGETPAKDTPVLDFTVSLEVLEFSNLLSAPLGDRLNALRIEGRFVGAAVAVTAAGLTPMPAPDSRIEIEDLDLRWPPVSLAGTGDVMLDDRGRPEGRLEAWWRDLPRLIDHLASLGMVDGNAVPALKLALLTLPSRKGSDGATERRMPIVARDGRLFLGPVEIARINPLR